MTLNFTIHFGGCRFYFYSPKIYNIFKRRNFKCFKGITGRQYFKCVTGIISKRKKV